MMSTALQYPQVGMLLKGIARVVDGDTVQTVEGEKYRLYGIDAPEKRQEYGFDSMFALEGYLKEHDNRVFVQFHGKEKYGRTLATLYAPATGDVNTTPANINYRMVLNGHAWSYRFKNEESTKASPQPPLDTYDSAETVARITRVGLWSTLTRGIVPESPSHYRRRIKRERRDRNKENVEDRGKKKGHRKSRHRKRRGSSHH